MKQLKDMLKFARRVEVLVVIAMICVLAILFIGEKDAMQAVGNEQEVRLQRILSQIEGAGRVTVMISEAADGTPTGVLVTASGADQLRVMLEIQRAVRTLTGLELDRIEIVKSKR